MGAGRIRVGATFVGIVAITTACTFGATETQDPPEENASGPVEIRVWDFNYTPNQKQGWSYAFDQSIEAYMAQNPEITIEYDAVPFGSAYEKYRAAIAAKEGPDVVTMYPGTNAATFKPGLLALEDRLTPEMEADLINLKESYSPDGHLYAVPHTLYAYIWAYNKAVFDEVGLPTTPPETWEELLSACRTLAEAGRVPMAMGFQEGFMLEGLLYMFGDQMLSSEERDQFIAGDLPVNSPLFATALEHVLTMQDNQCFGSESLSRIWTEATREFAKGEAGMTLSGLSWGELEDIKGATLRTAIGEENLGIFATPPLPGGLTPPGMTDAGVNSGYSVMAFTEHPDEAWDFVSFMLAPEQQRLLWEEAHAFPNSREALGSISSDDPIEMEELEILKNPANFTIYTGFPLQAIHTFYRATNPFLTRAQSAQEVLDAMQEDFARVMPGLKA